MNDDGEPSTDGHWLSLPKVQRLPSGQCVVHVSGGLIGESAGAVRRLGIEELERPPAQLVLELSGVTEIDHMGVRALTAIAESAGEADIDFCLVGAQTGPVAIALEWTGHTELFEIVASLDDP